MELHISNALINELHELSFNLKKDYNLSFWGFYSSRCSDIQRRFVSFGTGCSEKESYLNAQKDFFSKVINGFFLDNYPGNNKRFCISFEKEDKDILFSNYSEEYNIAIFPDSISKKIDNLEQSDILLLEKELSFYYDMKNPNSQDINKVISFWKDFLKSKNKKYFSQVPFTSIRNDNKVIIPYDILLNISNGIGSYTSESLEEAEYESILSILETHAKNLFNLYPETFELIEIPLEDIVSTYSFAREFITNLTNLYSETLNHSIIFKFFDCSFQGKLPILGILLFDKTSQKFRIKFAADISFEKALKKSFCNLLLGINPSQTLSLTQDFIDFTFFKYSKLFTSTKNNYSQFKWKNTSTEESLKILKEKTLKVFDDIFIRDNSYKGIPVVMTYIPGALINNKEMNSNTLKYLSALDNFKVKENTGMYFSSIEKKELLEASKNNFFPDMYQFFLKIPKEIIEISLEYDIEDYNSVLSDIEKIKDDSEFFKYFKYLTELIILSYDNYTYEEDIINLISRTSNTINLNEFCKLFNLFYKSLRNNKDNSPGLFESLLTNFRCYHGKDIDLQKYLSIKEERIHRAYELLVAQRYKDDIELLLNKSSKHVIDTKLSK